MEKLDGMKVKDEDLGLILWKLESIEHFYPCFNSMLKKEE